jgi:hypothetical protein
MLIKWENFAYLRQEIFLTGDILNEFYSIWNLKFVRRGSHIDRLKHSEMYFSLVVQIANINLTNRVTDRVAVVPVHSKTLILHFCGAHLKMA